MISADVFSFIYRLGDSRNYMPPILVLSPAKRKGNINFSNCKFKWEKRFWELLFVISFVPARNYLSKVSNLSTRIMCESCSILRMSMLTIFNITDVNDVVLVSLLLTVNILDWLITKRQTYLKTRSSISCVMYYFKCEQNLLTNSIWTYTITTLWVNQWEIFARARALPLGGLEGSNNFIVTRRSGIFW